MKEKNEKSSNQENKLKVQKESLGSRFIHTIKKRWLISGTNTILLIAILIAATILINVFVASLDLTPIDCTSNKEYTLTNESKRKVQDITDSINIYFVGFEEESAEYSLVKQYNKANSNINVETINVEERIDIAEKYNVSNDSYVIIVENGERSKVISSDDLYTYDSSYNTIDLTEETVTSAILNVTSKEIPKVYFLGGYSNYSLDESGGMYYLSQYLNDEVLTYETLNMLTAATIPEDCAALVITTPTEDFDVFVADEIIKYINKGGNILWLNAAYATKLDLPNVNRVLAEYGIDPFDSGYIYETSSDRIVGLPIYMEQPLGKSTEIDKNLVNVVLSGSTKININSEKQEELKINAQELISTGSTTYFKKDVSNTESSTDEDEQGGFTIGGIYTKTISGDEDSENTDDNSNNAIKSELVIFGDNNFITDMQIANNMRPIIYLDHNKDVVLNSIAYLTNQESGITIRKDYNKSSEYTATDGQKITIMKIIFTVPIAIIVLGIVVWQIRRRKK